jgi:hypothetical protein
MSEIDGKRNRAYRREPQQPRKKARPVTNRRTRDQLAEEGAADDQILHEEAGEKGAREHGSRARSGPRRQAEEEAGAIGVPLRRQDDAAGPDVLSHVRGALETSNGGAAGACCVLGGVVQPKEERPMNSEMRFLWSEGSIEIEIELMGEDPTDRIWLIRVDGQALRLKGADVAVLLRSLLVVDRHFNWTAPEKGRDD